MRAWRGPCLDLGDVRTCHQLGTNFGNDCQWRLITPQNHKPWARGALPKLCAKSREIADLGLARQQYGVKVVYVHCTVCGL